MNDWLRNCWYMAGWAEEVGERGLVRQIIGQQVFIYRLAEGGLAAVTDRLSLIHI